MTPEQEDKFHAECAAADDRLRIRALEKELADLKKAIIPFILHGKALEALDRADVATAVSEKDSSSLCIGAFKNLMNAVDPDEFGL